MILDLKNIGHGVEVYVLVGQLISIKHIDEFLGQVELRRLDLMEIAGSFTVLTERGKSRARIY